MMPLNLERVEKNAREATTQDLLDRVTVYREDMEPEAILVIEAELRRRGVDRQTWEQHDQQGRRDALYDHNGMALRCTFCHAPAVKERWGWHKLWGKLPVFPRRQRYCQAHKPVDRQHDDSAGG